MKACDMIDLIIEIIRGSKRLNDVKQCLIYGKTDSIRFKTKKAKELASKLHFSERQASH